MAKQNQTGDATPGRTAEFGADQGYKLQEPQPSESAAAAAGAVGPGALAAAEMTSEASTSAQPKRATEAGGAAGLSHDDIETLRGLAQRVGGVDALIRWLQLHTDLK